MYLHVDWRGVWEHTVVSVAGWWAGVLNKRFIKFRSKRRQILTKKIYGKIEKINCKQMHAFERALDIFNFFFYLFLQMKKKLFIENQTKAGVIFCCTTNAFSTKSSSIIPPVTIELVAKEDSFWNSGRRFIRSFEPYS